jgi:sterol desaturase/sphingolipid hydroxylase (fatty acid hydroxylase superfamily)
MRPTIWTLAFVSGIFCLFFLLERAFPLRRRTRSLFARLLVNLTMSGLAFLVAAIVVRPAALGALNWSAEKPFGLAHAFQLPAAVQFIVSFLWMDLTFYWWHIANHRILFLWRFHNVHHIDPNLDVSTGFRFHFGEVAMSAVFRAVQVAAIGISAPAFAAYEIVFQANTLFHHSNLRLPIQFERWLNKLLVTPRMHGIHHSQIQRETNSNYGVVFPWWDRLHRTLGLNVPQSEIKIGVPGYSQPEDNSFMNALLMPFRKQRQYWARSDGSTVERGVTGNNCNKTTLVE